MIRWFPSNVDAFSGMWNLIMISESAIKKYQLHLEECFACIAHEIGHYLDPTIRIGKNNEERELNADKKVIELGLQEHLISALKKLCADDTPEQKLLTNKRIKALEESFNR